MIIFVSHVGPHIPNIEYLKVYEGIWGYMRSMKVYEGIWKVYEGIPIAVPNVSLLLRYVQVEAVLVQVLFQMMRYCCAMWHY